MHQEKLAVFPYHTKVIQRIFFEKINFESLYHIKTSKQNILLNVFFANFVSLRNFRPRKSIFCLIRKYLERISKYWIVIGHFMLLLSAYAGK